MIKLNEGHMGSIITSIKGSKAQLVEAREGKQSTSYASYDRKRKTLLGLIWTDVEDSMGSSSRKSQGVVSSGTKEKVKQFIVSHLGDPSGLEDWYRVVALKVKEHIQKEGGKKGRRSFIIASRSLDGMPETDYKRPPTTVDTHITSSGLSKEMRKDFKELEALINKLIRDGVVAAGILDLEGPDDASDSFFMGLTLPAPPGVDFSMKLATPFTKALKAAGWGFKEGPKAQKKWWRAWYYGVQKK